MSRGGRTAIVAASVILGAGGGVPAQGALGTGDSTAAGEPGRGASRPARGVLRLRAGTVDVSQRRSAFEPGQTAVRPGQHCVMVFDGPMTPERHAALERSGVRYEGYIPDDAAIVSLGGNPDGARNLGFVKWIGAYDGAWKLDPDLRGPPRPFETADRRAIEGAGQVAVSVYLFDGEELAPFLAELRTIPGSRFLGSEVVGETRTVVVTVARSRLSGLAGLASVRFVEEFPEFSARNDDSRWIVQANQLNMTPLYDHGLTGTGQILGFIDNALSTTHCSFNDPSVTIDGTNTPGVFPAHRKVLAYNASYTSNDFHGTHVAGTCVGDAGSWNDTRGVAYQAKLVYNTFPSVNETSVFNRFNTHYSQGAFVHNNSWGNSGTTQYDGTCRAIDNFCWQYDDNLIVYAVADSATLRNPENAKNCLSVAATGSAPNQAGKCYGAMGPTNDGRMRPEIMAPGCGIVSALYNTSCGTISKTGTSMAAPAVSATAILARQYFTSGYYPSGIATPSDVFLPSGALLKAVLINSAMDLTNDLGSPTNKEGWGRVQADEALYFAGDSRRLVLRDVRNNQAGALTTGQTGQHGVLVNGSSQKLKITLAYHDAPATLPATFAPVNRVYLEVIAPDATVYYGNNVTDGVSNSGGAPETLNNVQQVIVPAPATGGWSVNVVANAVNVGSQGYALVITGDVSELCPSDFDGNGFVNGEDFDAFVDAFVQGDPSADFDGNQFVNGEDFDAFAEAFEAGC